MIVQLLIILISVLVLAFWIQSNHIIDTQNCDGGLSRKFQRLDLGDCRLEDTSLPVITD